MRVPVSQKFTQRERWRPAKKRKRDPAAPAKCEARGRSRTFAICGFADAVPVFQCGFEIAFKKIGGAEKVVGVAVVGRKAKRLAQTLNRLRDSFFA